MFPLLPSDAQSSLLIIYAPLVFLPTVHTLSPCFEPSLAFFPCPHGQIEDDLNNFDQDRTVNQNGPSFQQHPPRSLLLEQKSERALKLQNQKGDNIQLKNRNILPNTVNVILSYLRRPSRSRKAAERVIRRLGLPHLQQTLRQFYAYQGFLKNNATDFITRQAIQALMRHHNPHCAFFSLEEQQLHNKIFRILVRHYLRQHYLPSILSSAKLTPVKRRDHLKVLRYLQAVICGRDFPRGQVQGSWE